MQASPYSFDSSPSSNLESSPDSRFLRAISELIRKVEELEDKICPRIDKLEELMGLNLEAQKQLCGEISLLRSAKRKTGPASNKIKLRQASTRIPRKSAPKASNQSYHIKKLLSELPPELLKGGRKELKAKDSRNKSERAEKFRNSLSGKQEAGHKSKKFGVKKP